MLVLIQFSILFRSDSVKKEGTKTTPFNTVTWADRVKGVSNASNTQAPKTLKSSDIDQVIKKTAEPSKDKAVKDEQSDGNAIKLFYISEYPGGFLRQILKIKNQSSLLKPRNNEIKVQLFKTSTL